MMKKRKKFKSGFDFSVFSSEKLLSNALKSFLVFIITILALTSIGGCATMDKEKNQDSIGSISFSPDGKKILFNRKNDGNPYYMIQVYDLQTGELSAYKSPDGEQWGDARYSFDGKSIVFVIITHKGDQWDLANSQIAVTDKGKGVKSAFDQCR